MPVQKEAVVLDINQARANRDAGIKKAVNHANKIRPGWGEDAYKFLKKFLAGHNGPFMAEDVRSYAALLDFELPPNDRSWGAIIVRAKKEGLIEQRGTRKVKNKKANCANAAVWIQIKTY